MTQAYDRILLEQPEVGIYLLTFNTPKQMNALSQLTIAEFTDAVERVDADENARVLILTGAGDKAFVAGADISEFTEAGALDARRIGQAGGGVIEKLERLDIPVVAAINGYALGGGCEVALGCDWMIASEKAMFGQPEINLGIMPGFGGTQRLMRAVGKRLAVDMCMTGRMIDAQEAHRVGLVNQVCGADELMDTALKLGHTLSSKAPIALKLIKQVMREGENIPLEHACGLEREMFGLCFTTADKDEGVSAFLEKRKPEFSGN